MRLPYTRIPEVGGAPGQATAAGTAPVPFISGAGAPTDGVTGAGVAAKGTLYLNTTNGQYYTNVGTAGATLWQVVMQA